MAESGLVGIGLPESVGGGGLGFLEVCIVLEEVGRARGAGAGIRGDGARRARARANSAHTDVARRRRRRVRASSPPRCIEPHGDPYAPATTWSSRRSGGRRHAGGREGLRARPGSTPSASSCPPTPACSCVDPAAAGVTVEREDTTSGVPEARVVLDGAPAGEAGRARGRHLAARARAGRGRVHGGGRVRDVARAHRRVHEGPRAVRPADRVVPGGEPAGRRRLHRHRGRAAHRVAGRVAARPRAARGGAGRHRQVLGGRGRAARRARRATTCTAAWASTATTRCTATSCS